MPSRDDGRQQVSPCRALGVRFGDAILQGDNSIGEFSHEPRIHILTGWISISYTTLYPTLLAGGGGRGGGGGGGGARGKGGG